MGEEIEVDSPLAGRHQLRNIALAIATAEELNHFGFKVTPKQVEQGIRETHWPGRFQVLPPSAATHQREMVLDVAHNPAGAWALRSALSENFAGRELTFVFAALRDKAIQEIAEILFPIAEQVVVTQVGQSARRDHGGASCKLLRGPERCCSRRKQFQRPWRERARSASQTG